MRTCKSAALHVLNTNRQPKIDCRGNDSVVSRSRIVGVDPDQSRLAPLLPSKHIQPLYGIATKAQVLFAPCFYYNVFRTTLCSIDY